LWKTAQPIMQGWMRERVSPVSILKRLRAHAPELSEAITILPQLLHRATQLVADGKFNIPVQEQQAAAIRAELRAGARRRDYAILAAALIVSGMLWLTFVREPWWPGLASLAAGLLVFWRSRR